MLLLNNCTLEPTTTGLSAKQTDYYPLGLILFEILYNFTTGMEKHRLFKSLKEEHTLPEILEEKFPELADLIVKLTHSDPLKRPDLTEAFDTVSAALSIKKRSSSISAKEPSSPTMRKKTFSLKSNLHLSLLTAEKESVRVSLVNGVLALFSESTEIEEKFDVSDLKLQLDKDVLRLSPKAHKDICFPWDNQTEIKDLYLKLT